MRSIGPRSLRAKLVRTMVAMVLIVASATLLVVAVMNYVSARATLSTIESHLRDNIRRKGSDLVSSQGLALRDLVADNAFGDVARLVERTVEGDEDISFGVFLGEDQKPWAFATRLATPSGGRLRDWRELGLQLGPIRAKGVHATTGQVLGNTVLQFGVRVVDDKDDQLGSLWYALSPHSLQRALADARTASRRALVTTIILLLLLGTGASILGSAFSRRAAARITQPLGELTIAANALAEGRRDIRVSIDSGDELEQLGTAFNHMVTEIRDYTVRLEEMNRGLEAKVDERTRALGERNRDMRLVLDNVHQGFLTLSRDGRLAQERSAIVDRWFGAYGPDTLFSDYIARIDPLFAESFVLGFEALWEDFLPRQLCLEQLPHRVNHGDSQFRCTYFPLGSGDRREGVLVVVDDITGELRSAQQEAERAEILAMLEACTKDRAGLLGFVDETNELLAGLGSADLATQKRLVHTIKGNAAMVGLSVVARLCHSLEDVLAERHAPLPTGDLTSLQNRWEHLTATLGTFIGDRARDFLEVPVEEVARLDAEIRAGLPAARLAERLASWTLEPAERPLVRLGNHARALAARVGKGRLKVVVDGGHVRLSPGRWTPLWAELVHVVSNAVDHGLETPAARRSAGKTEDGNLRLSAYRADQQLVIEIEDDGAGVDWAAVARAASRRGLPHHSHEDLARAIFAPEVTTRSEVSVTSGRGVGLAAVRTQVELMGGTATVRSRPGEGTCFVFTFPVAEIGGEHEPGATTPRARSRSAYG